MKLKIKLIVYYLIATLLALLFVGYAVLKGIQGLSINTMEKQLTDQSRLAEIYITQIHILEGNGSDGISTETANSVISKLGLILGNVHIYDKDLNLLASSKSSPLNIISDDENKSVLNSALKGSYAYIVKKNTVCFASPVNLGDNIIAILQIIYPMSFLQSLVSGVTNILLAGTIFFTLLITLLSAYIAGKLTKPINMLAKAARNYANREFAPVEIKSSDEIAQLSRSFNAMGIELQEYIRRQKQFVSNVSHELRTPLTAIKGYSAYLMEEIEDRPDLKKAVYHLNNESARLERLVDEVLTLSRIDTGRESFDFKRIDFSELIRETAEKMMLRAEKYGIKIVTGIEPGIFITGDSEKLIQVIINLLDNAFKFSPSKSTVHIEGKIDGGLALLSVTDQGIGIPKEDTVKVFDRFYRAKNAQGVSGTGLGLSIVKYIVDAHNGSIEALAGAAGGTVVLVWLPLNK